MSEYREVTGGSYLSWDAPKEVEGVLVDVVDVETKFGRTAKVTLRREDGSEVWFYAPAMLQSRLREVRRGQLVKVVFTGEYETSKSGRPVKRFRVFVAEQ